VVALVSASCARPSVLLGSIKARVQVALAFRQILSRKIEATQHAEHLRISFVS
jgi:hypothetical protein